MSQAVVDVHPGQELEAAVGVALGRTKHRGRNAEDAADLLHGVAAAVVQGRSQAAGDPVHAHVLGEDHGLAGLAGTGVVLQVVALNGLARGLVHGQWMDEGSLVAVAAVLHGLKVGPLGEQGLVDGVLAEGQRRRAPEAIPGESPEVQNLLRTEHAEVRRAVLRALAGGVQRDRSHLERNEFGHLAIEPPIDEREGIAVHQALKGQHAPELKARDQAVRPLEELVQVAGLELHGKSGEVSADQSDRPKRGRNLQGVGRDDRGDGPAVGVERRASAIGGAVAVGGPPLAKGLEHAHSLPPRCLNCRFSSSASCS